MSAVPVDTNILVRLATGDSPIEHEAAVKFFESKSVLILPTVLLETEWVLRSLYGYSAGQFLAFAQWLIEGAKVELSDAGTVREALRLHGSGFDFADAMHLAASQGRPFATFDRALVKRARRRRVPIHAMTNR
jgi:predicted nucleic acid-binding protein